MSGDAERKVVADTGGELGKAEEGGRWGGPLSALWFSGSTQTRGLQESLLQLRILVSLGRLHGLSNFLTLTLVCSIPGWKPTDCFKSG